MCNIIVHVVHSTAWSSSDYLTDKHHSSDTVYWRGGRGTARMDQKWTEAGLTHSFGWVEFSRVGSEFFTVACVGSGLNFAQENLDPNQRNEEST